MSATSGAPSIASRTVGCSKVPGSAPRPATVSRVHTAPEAAGTRSGASGDDVRAGQQFPDAGRPQRRLGRRRQLLHREDVDVVPAHQVEHRPGRDQALPQADRRDADPGPLAATPAGDLPARDSTAPASAAPAPADSTAAGTDRAQAATASGRTAAPAA